MPVDQIFDNAKAFSKALMVIASSTEVDFEDAVTKTVFDVLTKIVERTPFDTGRAKASTHVSITEPSDDDGIYTGEDFGSAQAALDYARKESGNWSFEIRDKEIWVYNNLEYIENLEDGSSQQRSNGMFAVTLQEFTHIFNKYIKTNPGFIPF